MAEKDPTFDARFDTRVTDWYGKMRESGNIDALALLSWTREAIRSRGPASPEKGNSSP